MDKKNSEKEKMIGHTQNDVIENQDEPKNDELNLSKDKKDQIHEEEKELIQNDAKSLDKEMVDEEDTGQLDLFETKVAIEKIGDG